MNIDISNAHCGPRIQFPDHAWLRVVLVPRNCLRREARTATTRQGASPVPCARLHFMAAYERSLDVRRRCCAAAKTRLARSLASSEMTPMRKRAHKRVRIASARAPRDCPRKKEDARGGAFLVYALALRSLSVRPARARVSYAARRPRPHTR